MYELKRRVYNLLSVKSLVTLVLTAVFAWLAATQRMSQELMSVYTVVVGFYFGTQAKREGSA